MKQPSYKGFAPLSDAVIDAACAGDVDAIDRSGAARAIRIKTRIRANPTMICPFRFMPLSSYTQGR